MIYCLVKFNKLGGLKCLFEFAALKSFVCVYGGGVVLLNNMFTVLRLNRKQTKLFSIDMYICIVYTIEI